MGYVQPHPLLVNRGSTRKQHGPKDARRTVSASPGVVMHQSGRESGARWFHSRNSAMPVESGDDVRRQGGVAESLRVSRAQHGAEDHGGQRDADEQGPGGDRGALPVRRGVRQHRHRHSPPVYHPLHGRDRRLLCARPGARPPAAYTCISHLFTTLSLTRKYQGACMS